MNRTSIVALCLALLPALSAFAADAPTPAAAAPAAAAPAAPPAAAAKAPAKAAPAKAAAHVAPRVPAGALFDTIRKRGTLLVGTAWSIPWSMRDPQGEWQGFEIDLARQLAADLGVDLTIVRVPFAEFTSALASGRIDVVVAGYSITPQRALVVDFSNAYADSQMELVVRKDLAAQDVNRAGVKVGVRAGTTSEAAARNRLPQAEIVAFPTARKLYEAAKAGEVDGAFAYAPRTTMAVAQSEGRLAVATGVGELPRTVEAFAVRKGEQSLLNFLNAWVAYWKADGWIAERHKYWFETLDWTTRFATPGGAAAK
jgi:polar amino acid transport system substrate-binding protein